MKFDAIFHPLTPAAQGEAAVKSASRLERMTRAHETPAGRVADLPPMPAQHKAIDIDANNRLVRKFLALMRQTDPEFQKFITDQSRKTEAERRFWLRYFTERDAANQFWFDYDLKIKTWLERRFQEIGMHAHETRETQKQRRLYAQGLAMFYQALNLYDAYADKKKQVGLAAHSVEQNMSLQVMNAQHHATERLHFSLRNTSSEMPVNRSIGQGQYVQALTDSRIARDQASTAATASTDGGSFAKGSRPRFTKLA